jgi:methyltransferase (TIGR00027 family)
MRRAAHQLYDVPLILDDPITLLILGQERCDKLRSDPTRQAKPIAVSMRAYLALRSRFAEDHLAAAVAAGATQYCILGAGLDTFAHRNPHPHLRVFEVDFPATQAWKHDMLAAAALPHPDNLTYVPTDFEHQTLRDALHLAGFRPAEKTFFSWLGVVPYLTLEAFRSTLAFAASQPSGSAIAFDYALPRESLSTRGQHRFDYLAARVRRAGEPLQIFFTPPQIAAELAAAGYATPEDLNPVDLAARYLSASPERTRTGADSLTLRRDLGHHLICARR